MLTTGGGVGVAAGVGVGVAAAWIVILPGGVLEGRRTSRSVFANWKSFGDAAQVRGVLAPGVLLTRVICRTNNVPAPDNPVEPSVEKAETRRVRMGPPPGRTLPDTFQLLAVRPLAATGGLWKVTMVESKVKSPENPIRLSFESRFVVVTG